MKKFTGFSLRNYTKVLSSKEPIPGGGSASAYVASLGMSLGEMVAQIGGKKVAPEWKTTVDQAVKILRQTKSKALQVVDLDPKVYAAVMSTYKKARSVTDPTKKERMIDEALENSFRLQADLALLVVMAKEAIDSLDGIIKGSIQNDLKVGRTFLEAAFHGAYDTAQINVVYLKNPEAKRRAEEALLELKKRFETATHAARN